MRRAQAADDGDVCQLHRHLISAKSAAHAAAAAGPGQRARRLPSFLFLPAQLPLAGAEAGADVGIPLALPEQMPDLALDTVSGYRLHEQYASLTAVYGKVEEGQAMSLSVEVQDLPEDSYALTQRDMDAGSRGSYTTPSGITYTTWSESNEDGSKTAQVLSYSRDGLEYGMAFFGFTEAQWQAVADSLDLGIYD